MPNLDLLVFTYDDETAAIDALRSVVEAKQDNTNNPLLAVSDAAVGMKDEKGKVRVVQTMEMATKGGQVLQGGFWGLLIGFIFGGALLGAFVGMGLRALGSRSVDVGVDNNFIKEVSDSLTPGQSALFLLMSETDPGDVRTALGDHGGRLHHTTLDEETAAKLADLANDEAIAKAIDEEN